MGHNDNYEVSDWMMQLVRYSTNSKLSVHIPVDIAMLMNQSINDLSQSPEPLFETIRSWAAVNYPQWGIVNIVPA